MNFQKILIIGFIQSLFIGLNLKGQTSKVEGNASSDPAINSENSNGSPSANTTQAVDTMPTEQELQKLAEPPVEVTAPSTDIKSSESNDYRYDPAGKRDPFRPFRDSKIGIGLLRTLERPLEPLEKFDISTLEVVAIVWGNEKPRALILDPDKQIHSVVKGQRIGRNEGVVAEIREGEVVAVEVYDLNGKVIKDSIIIPIKK